MAIQKSGASFQKHPQLTDTSAAYSHYMGYGGYEITLSGGTVKGGIGMYLPNTGTATISGGTVTLAEADESVPLVGDNSRDGRVVVTQSEPWPFTLLMLETDVETENEERGRR